MLESKHFGRLHYKIAEQAWINVHKLKFVHVQLRLYISQCQWWQQRRMQNIWIHFLQADTTSVTQFYTNNLQSYTHTLQIKVHRSDVYAF